MEQHKEFAKVKTLKNDRDHKIKTNERNLRPLLIVIFTARTLSILGDWNDRLQ